MLSEQAQAAIYLVVWLSLPSIVAATAVGLLVGLFQGLTQIQDQTLPHGLKLIAVTIAILFTGYAFGNELIRFSTEAFESIAVVGR